MSGMTECSAVKESKVKHKLFCRFLIGSGPPELGNPEYGLSWCNTYPCHDKYMPRDKVHLAAIMSRKTANTAYEEPTKKKVKIIILALIRDHTRVRDHL